jgi:hypothetical protein
MSNQIVGETLITLAEAAQDFGGISIPVNTVQKYVYQGVKGLKLESISINGRYTSREAIVRFIERKQDHNGKPQPPKIRKLPQSEVDARLRKYGIK